MQSMQSNDQNLMSFFNDFKMFHNVEGKKLHDQNLNVFHPESKNKFLNILKKYLIDPNSQNKQPSNITLSNLKEPEITTLLMMYNFINSKIAHSENKFELYLL